MRKSLLRALAAIPLSLGLTACSSSSAIGMEPMMRPTPGPMAGSTPSRTAPPDRIDLTGRFVKLTGFPCHRSDSFVGNETVVFLASDGSRSTSVTDSANWIGMGATRSAPLGQCRQVAPFEAELPVADRYVVLINDRRLPPVTLATFRAEGFRHTFRLPS